MKLKYQISVLLILTYSFSLMGQDISLYKQFNGRYDFVFIGNTLNLMENNSLPGQPPPPCTILTSSSDSLILNANDVIEKAYLYWAGSGTGDFDIKLNGVSVTPDRTFSIIQSTSSLPFFSAFKDITGLVQTQGNGLYTLSDLDLTNVISSYCGNGTNFGGWTIVVVYKNNSLPLNQLNIYDGLQAVPSQINIRLNSLNVIDNQDAKIGFVAWEGDKNIAVNESLRINGNIISNPPLNPANNAFNGTNSFTNSSLLFNMDLDVYNIQNNINIGDTTAQIQLTSGQDFVMINSIITKLNSQLPDATVVINQIHQSCDSKTIIVDYTIFNSNSTAPLPSGTTIAFYANNQLIGITTTTVTIPIDGSWSNSISLTIPNAIPDDFTIKVVADDLGNGNGIITEIDESNNSATQNLSFWFSPKFNPLNDIESCDLGFGSGNFNFSEYANSVKVNTTDFVSFHQSFNDATQNSNPISDYIHFFASNSPKEIFVRISNEHCYSITSFHLVVIPCPPLVHNVLTPNNDQLNDSFFIEGLRDIFIHFKLEIYNRWGTLLWTGNNNTPDWDGYANTGIGIDNAILPTGTYFYLLYLNDSRYPEPLKGFVYLTR